MFDGYAAAEVNTLSYAYLMYIAAFRAMPEDVATDVDVRPEVEAITATERQVPRQVKKKSG